MRPIRLQLKGFTSFRDPQEIDFTDLDLFAIVGPTGSGKSSLLDAITYALFGEVDRVGKGVSQLVSQGQPRMAVTFEFEAAGERYRITRSTAAASTTGQTKILLELREGDGEWSQAGEGADRVRDVNARLQRTIGLDYDAFTRSVLLPQGRFAEFLVGEARDRREILTELLGLELFKRLAKGAGEIRTSAATTAQAKADLLDTEYEGITADAVAAAKATAKAAAAREKSIATATRTVNALAKRGERDEAQARELRDCADQATSLAATAGEAAAALALLETESAEASEAVQAAAQGAEELAKEAGRAADAVANAEEEWGRATDLVASRTRAEELERRRHEIARAEEEHARIQGESPKRESAAAGAGKAAERARIAHEGVAVSATSAREAFDAAQHADLVAAVRAGAAVGEPCPVCGTEIGKLPRATPGGVNVHAAKSAFQAAERKLAESDAVARDAELDRTAAEAALAETTKELARSQKELDRRREELVGQEAKLADALGGAEDPLAAIDERIAELERLAAVERTTAKAAAEAERLRDRAERELTAVLGRLGEHRVSLAAQPISALTERASRLCGGDVSLPPMPSLGALPDQAADLAQTATSAREFLRELADVLEALAERREADGERLLAEAQAAVEGLLQAPVTGGLEELAELVGEAAREATAGTATAAEQAARLGERLASSRALAVEVRGLKERAERFAALAKELRADNIIEFLQLEALQLLAAAGSERLSTLSDGRYRLAFDADEFFVIDTWNGEELRSARTLSGGETFLASLALALALSEQVQSLAVTHRARLESLFLDEGFGTLDPETLETVVAAIEQLGGDGRLVGVITHVQELAIRLPARVEVEKSPRGSRLSVVA